MAITTRNFTTKWIEHVKPGPSGRDEYFDTHIEGLGLRVGLRTKTFFVMPRILRLGQWRQERISLGRVGDITLAEARDAAKKALETAAAGQIPTQVGKERREELVRDSANTFGKVRQDFLPLYRVKRSGRLYLPAPRTLHAMNAVLESLKAWDDLPLASITQADLQNWHDGYLANGKESAANRYLANLRIFFKWAKTRGIIKTDPAANVAKGGAYRSRERVLTHDELTAIWNATGGDHPYHSIVRLLVLTGQRREEIGGMAWSELNLGTALWILPANRSKNHRPHLIPLSPPALDIIRAQQRYGREGLVFGNRNGKPFSDWTGNKERLDASLDIAPWWLHDLRRSMITHMSEDLGIPPHVVESIVNHVSGFRAGVAGTYNKALYLDERIKALNAWASHILALAEIAKREVA